MMRTLCLSVALVALLAPTAAARYDGTIDFDLRARADLEVEARADGRHEYRWEWGDGTTSVGAHARHAYDRPGVYRVVAVAVDEDGREHRRARQIEVRAAPAPSHASIEVERDVARAEASAEAGARFEWDWGDGERSRGRHATHVYAEPGTYEVTLKVTHRDGSCTYERRTVVVHGVSEARHETRARSPGVSLSVSLGHDHEDDTDEDERRHAEWRSETRVHSSSHEKHDVPGFGVPLLGAGLGGAALLLRARRR